MKIDNIETKLYLILYFLQEEQFKINEFLETFFML